MQQISRQPETTKPRFRGIFLSTGDDAPITLDATKYFMDSFSSQCWWSRPRAVHVVAERSQDLAKKQPRETVLQIVTKSVLEPTYFDLSCRDSMTQFGTIRIATISSAHPPMEARKPQTAIYPSPPNCYARSRLLTQESTAVGRRLNHRTAWIITRS